MNLLSASYRLLADAKMIFEFNYIYIYMYACKMYIMLVRFD